MSNTLDYILGNNLENTNQDIEKNANNPNTPNNSIKANKTKKNKTENNIMNLNDTLTNNIDKILDDKLITVLNK